MYAHKVDLGNQQLVFNIYIFLRKPHEKLSK